MGLMLTSSACDSTPAAPPVVHFAALRILVVTATDMEVAPFVAALRDSSRHAVDVLATGVGMVATAARCSRALARTRYDLALNFGVCGSFDPALGPGTVVHVVADRLAELGAEDGEAFLTIEQLQLLDGDAFPFRGGQLLNVSPPANATLGSLPAVGGITVNTVHGDDRSIALCDPALQSAGGEHGRRGLHVRLPD